MQPETKARLQTYLGLLEKWQKSVNLVAPNSIPDAWDRHFIDSLQIERYLPKDAQTLVDLGSGAGFPGLVLAIVRPDLEVHLIESDSKKATFLSVVSRETQTKNVTVHTGRVESVLPTLKADVITARALASLSDLLALTESQWAYAAMVFLKGADSASEIDSARETYHFDQVGHVSETAANARILCITGVSRK